MNRIFTEDANRHYNSFQLNIDTDATADDRVWIGHFGGKFGIYKAETALAIAAEITERANQAIARRPRFEMRSDNNAAWVFDRARDYGFATTRYNHLGVTAADKAVEAFVRIMNKMAADGDL